MGFTNKDEHKHHVDYEADMHTGITTFHGLVRIYNSQNAWARVFWILVSFTAMVVFFIQSYYTIEAYREHPTTVQSNFSVPHNGIEFPDITICNFSPVNQRLVDQLYPNMSEDAQRYAMWSYLQVENLYSQVDDVDFWRVRDAFENYTEDYLAYNGQNFSIPDFFFDVGFRCEEMFKSCSFGGIEIPDCCNFSHPVLTDIGRCYKFKEFGNHTWTKSQLISGAYYGLHMIIDAQVDQYPDLFVVNFLDSGIKFYIHPDEIIPMLSSMGSAIPQGRKGFGAVTLRQYEFLGKSEWGHCQEEFAEGQLRHIQNSTLKYHAGNCETVCIANYFADRCHCVPLRYHLPTHDKDIPVCDPEAMYTCVNVSNMTGDFAERLDIFKSETYWYKSCNCTVECSKQDYDVEMSFSDFPTPSAAWGLAKMFNDTKERVKENYLVLNVYMKEIITENYKQQKLLSRTGVLSNVGGNMGMFLGMSVITLGEIFIFFLKSAWGMGVKQRRDDLARRQHEESASPEEEAAQVVSTAQSRLTVPLANGGDISPRSPREYSGRDAYETVYSEVNNGRKRSIVPQMTKAQETPTVSVVDHEKWLKDQMFI